MTRFAGAGGLLGLLVAALSGLAVSEDAGAHSASDAYLTLTADRSEATDPRVFHGQWDIALRDLDFVLKLDDDGDGRLSWGEVHRHQAAIERYAYQHLALEGGPGNACAIKPDRQLIDGHADGAYAALFFEAVCAHAPRMLTLRYSLFFAIDPSHRGILVMRNGPAVSTAVLSPENAEIDLLR
jgi:hypothetical protein